MAIEDVTVDEIENELARWLAVKVDRPREKDGWYTAGKVAEQAQCSRDIATAALKRGVAAGEVELKQYGNMKFYRIVKR